MPARWRAQARPSTPPSHSASPHPTEMNDTASSSPTASVAGLTGLAIPNSKGGELSPDPVFADSHQPTGDALGEVSVIATALALEAQLKTLKSELQAQDLQLHAKLDKVMARLKALEAKLQL